MFGQKAKSTRAAFNADVLTTFGKITQQAIDQIDGQPNRLVAELIEQYGWNEEVARLRVIGIGAHGLKGTASQERKTASFPKS